MLSLYDNKWKELEGGYRIPYDASIALRKLETSSNKQEIDSIFSELWNELHHQGDVGTASYYSVPHLIRIAKEKKLHDFNAIGLVTTIEIERHSDNPSLPEELETEYLHAIQNELPEIISQMMNESWDTTLTTVVLAALAVSKGHIELASAIIKMKDTDTLKEFLEKY
ncbi:MAG: hypothetical protein KDB99_15085 [Chitinophagaceae bacterium]|nr:hypothetical protein [Chitinophagaceae bacterium]MCB9056085.1 hypothetical protein [Chitinophagales bacterium]